MNLEEKIDFRLPDNLRPTSYDFQIQPYIGTNETWNDKAFTFDGIMNMHFTCVKPTRKVVFHIKDLFIDESKLELTKDNTEQISFVKKLEYDDLREFAILNLPSECVQNANYKLKIVYTGLIGANLYGFYRSSYVENGVTQ
jgi:hypothetical protein